MTTHHTIRTQLCIDGIIASPISLQLLLPKCKQKGSPTIHAFSHFTFTHGASADDIKALSPPSCSSAPSSTSHTSTSTFHPHISFADLQRTTNNISLSPRTVPRGRPRIATPRSSHIPTLQLPPTRPRFTELPVVPRSRPE
jgi:hypothetical protein